MLVDEDDANVVTIGQILKRLFDNGERRVCGASFHRDILCECIIRYVPSGGSSRVHIPGFTTKKFVLSVVR